MNCGIALPGKGNWGDCSEKTVPENNKIKVIENINLFMIEISFLLRLYK